jgi:hypothetical protein
MPSTGWEGNPAGGLAAVLRESHRGNRAAIRQQVVTAWPPMGAEKDESWELRRAVFWTSVGHSIRRRQSGQVAEAVEMVAEANEPIQSLGG